MNNIIVNLDNLSEEDRAKVMSLAEKASETMKEGLSGVKDGDTFKLAGIEFIKFPEVNGMTPVVTKDIIFNSEFGSGNNLKESEILKNLESEFLPKIIAAVGEENVCKFKTDLTTMDGLKPYGEMESMISLPTFDFYRANVEIFDKYKVDAWWWLATPDSAKPHYDPLWVLCVAPSGGIDISDYYDDGVRPILFFVSSIFDS